MRASWVLLVLLGCKREEHAPVPAPPPAPPVVSVSASAAAKITEGVVEVRPRAAILGDPSTVTISMPFDVAVGIRGVLRMELVDRVSELRVMEFDPRDPRCIFIDEIDIDRNTIVPIELTFERRKDGGLGYRVITPRASYTGAVLKDRLPVDDVRLTADVLKEPVTLDLLKYRALGGFAWAARDAGRANVFVIDEKAKHPHWVFRLQARSK